MGKQKPAPMMVLADIFPREIADKIEYPKVYGYSTHWRHWEKGEFYKKIPNTNWLRWTEGAFPATQALEKATHPAYVIDRTERLACICPCTTATQRDRPIWYVDAGKRLQDAPEPLAVTTYVLKNWLVQEADLEDLRGEYMGSWPEAWLVRED